MLTQPRDFWRVNSYGYPNPFSTNETAQQAWDTLLSFFQFNSYAGLKNYWFSTNAPRRISPHSVESWKATFEEYGLLYVLSGSDDIRITPAGHQFKAAGEAGNVAEFSWIGLSLLLRYPLRSPRRERQAAAATSDLLPYWFLYAAIRELQGYVWWTEIERVLCSVFRVSEAQGAIEDVRRLRAGTADIDDFPITQTQGGLYNSLNQVIVHAGMYYLLLGKSSDTSIYGTGQKNRRHVILPDALSLIDIALNVNTGSLDCDGDVSFVSRMPQAPVFPYEQAYFDYLGATVPDLGTFSNAAQPSILISGSSVAILKPETHYTVQSPTQIIGPISRLCRLGRGQRIILGHSLGRSFIVENKTRHGASEIVVTVRRAVPITNQQMVQDILESIDD